MNRIPARSPRRCASAQVAVLGSPNGGAAWNADVAAKLQASGVRLGPVTVIDVGAGTPTLAQLQTFRSVLVYSDAPFNDATTLGNNLKSYVDGGGGVVVCTFANASLPLGGGWATFQYDPITATGQAAVREAVAGGAGIHSQFVPTSFSYEPVTRRICEK